MQNLFRGVYILKTVFLFTLSAVNLNLIFFRIESYSCKMAGNDKKLFKTIQSSGGHNPADLQALSPPQSTLSLSPSK